MLHKSSGGTIHSIAEFRPMKPRCVAGFFAALYLPGGPDVRVGDMVEVFVNSVQQPEEELLGVVLGVALELEGALRHHILRDGTQGCKRPSPRPGTNLQCDSAASFFF